MTADSKISWTDHTFNPWWGCARVSPGCRSCYADTLASRWGHELWRRHGPRRPMAADYWRQPARWNRKGPARVFCGSMCDLFEAHPEPEVRAMQDNARTRLWALIDATPNLTWQLLTKRPENIAGMVPWSEHWPSNVWIGTSVEDQRRADERIPILRELPATVRFLSCEPLIAPVELAGRGWLPVSADDPDPDAECLTCGTEEFSDRRGHPVIHRCGSLTADPCEVLPNGDCAHDGDETGDWCDGPIKSYPRIDWLIIGGESGSKVRPMHLDWARSLIEQCRTAGTAVFVKQDSGPRPGMQGRIPDELWLKEFPTALAVTP